MIRRHPILDAVVIALVLLGIALAIGVTTGDDSNDAVSAEAATASNLALFAAPQVQYPIDVSISFVLEGGPRGKTAVVKPIGSFGCTFDPAAPIAIAQGQPGKFDGRITGGCAYKPGIDFLGTAGPDRRFALPPVIAQWSGSGAPDYVRCEAEQHVGYRCTFAPGTVTFHDDGGRP